MNTPVRAVAPVASMSLQADVGGMTIMPQSFGEVVSFADHMAKSSFVPAHLRGKPADCLAVCLQALRWGMDPFSVAQKTYFVRDGSPPGYEAQLLAAVVHARAPLEGRLNIEWDGNWPDRHCTVTGKMRGDPKPKIRRVDAKNITVRNSPLWKSDPDQQLAYYTIRAWARLYAPDTIMGVYGRDEMADQAVGADNAVDITPAAPTRAASNLDALERAIEPDQPAEVIDNDTGEITEPAAVYDPAKEYELLWQGALAEDSAIGVKQYWEQQREEGAPGWRLWKEAPDLFDELAGKIVTRHKVLKNGGSTPA